MIKFTLEDLHKIELDVSDRLDLFGKDREDVPFYSDGWKPVKSLWDYRWGKCSTLKWLAKPIEICRIIKAFPQKETGNYEKQYMPTNELRVALHENKELFFILQKRGNSENCSVFLELYEKRIENNLEFEKRKAWQERFINKVLREVEKERKREEKAEKKRDLRMLKKLKSVYKSVK